MNASPDSPLPARCTDGAQLVSRMTDLGILQRGERILERTDRPAFGLPGERLAAIETLDALRGKAAEVRAYYPFSGGMGLAAPQIGRDVRAALVVLPDSTEIGLLDPEQPHILLAKDLHELNLLGDVDVQCLLV